jgi:WD40 repeat protein
MLVSGVVAPMFLLPGFGEWSTRDEAVLWEPFRPSVAFSPDGALLAVISPDRAVDLWEVATGQLRQTLSEDTVGLFAEVAFDHKGNLLLADRWTRTISLWEVATGQLRQTHWASENVVKSAFSPDGGLLVHFLKTCCASAFAWERGRLARSGSGQDGRAPRDCTSSSVEMH